MASYSCDDTLLPNVVGSREDIQDSSASTDCPLPCAVIEEDAEDDGGRRTSATLKRSPTDELHSKIDRIEDELGKIDERARQLKRDRRQAHKELNNRKQAKLEAAIALAIPVTLTVSEMSGRSVDMVAYPGDTLLNVMRRTADEFGYDGIHTLQLLCGSEILESTRYVAELEQTELQVLRRASRESFDDELRGNAPRRMRYESCEEYRERICQMHGTVHGCEWFRWAIFYSVCFCMLEFVGGVTMFAITIHLGHTLSLWDALQPKPCQAISASCLGFTCSKGSCTRDIAVFFRIQEDAATPDIRDLGTAGAEFSYSVAPGLRPLRLIEDAGGDGVRFTAEAVSHAWTLESLDKSDVEHYLPEMMQRGLYVRIVSRTNRCLWANADGSLLGMVPKRYTGSGTEWIFSVTASGACCRIEAAAVTSSRRFLGPAGDGSVAELWPEGDAHVWDQVSLPADWLSYLRSPAPVGMYSGTVAVELNSKEAGIPTMREVERAWDLEAPGLFGIGVNCYTATYPPRSGYAAPAFPTILPVAKYHKDNLGSLLNIWIATTTGTVLGLTAHALIMSAASCLRVESIRATRVLLAANYLVHALLLTCVITSAVLFRLHGDMFDFDLEVALSFPPEHEIVWTDVWNATAADGYVGNSAEASGSCAPYCSTAVLASIISAALWTLRD